MIGWFLLLNFHWSAMNLKICLTYSILLIATVTFIASCTKGHCKKKSSFHAILENTTWVGEPENCIPKSDGTYSIVVVEKTDRKTAPDKFLFRHLTKLQKQKTFYTEEDVDGEPTVVFKVFEEFDGAIDTYYIVPDGESWLRVVSIDPDTDEWTIEFHLKMHIGTSPEPQNVTYGDTITFNQGEMKAVFRRG